MKRILFLFSIFFFGSIALASTDIFENIDFNFIDTAFDGIKAVSDEEFNKTIDKLTPQPVENTPSGRFKTFLFGRKYGSDDSSNTQTQAEFNMGGEREAIEDIKNGIYYIKLLVSIVGMEGKVIPLGNYKIQEEIINDRPLLVFYQGSKEYGKLRLRSFEDTEKNDSEITYYRIDVLSDNVIRIVYSTIKDTKCAVARIYSI